MGRISNKFLSSFLLGSAVIGAHTFTTAEVVAMDLKDDHEVKKVPIPEVKVEKKAIIEEHGKGLGDLFGDAEEPNKSPAHSRKSSFSSVEDLAAKITEDDLLNFGRHYELEAMQILEKTEPLDLAAIKSAIWNVISDGSKGLNGDLENILNKTENRKDNLKKLFEDVVNTWNHKINKLEQLKKNNLNLPLIEALEFGDEVLDPVLQKISDGSINSSQLLGIEVVNSLPSVAQREISLNLENIKSPYDFIVTFVDQQNLPFIEAIGEEYLNHFLLDTFSDLGIILGDQTFKKKKKEFEDLAKNFCNNELKQQLGEKINIKSIDYDVTYLDLVEELEKINKNIHQFDGFLLKNKKEHLTDNLIYFNLSDYIIDVDGDGELDINRELINNTEGMLAQKLNEELTPLFEKLFNKDKDLSLLLTDTVHFENGLLHRYILSFINDQAGTSDLLSEVYTNDKNYPFEDRQKSLLAIDENAFTNELLTYVMKETEVWFDNFKQIVDNEKNNVLETFKKAGVNKPEEAIKTAFELVDDLLHHNVLENNKQYKEFLGFMGSLDNELKAVEKKVTRIVADVNPNKKYVPGLKDIFSKNTQLAEDSDDARSLYKDIRKAYVEQDGHYKDVKNKIKTLEKESKRGPLSEEKKENLANLRKKLDDMEQGLVEGYLPKKHSEFEEKKPRTHKVHDAAFGFVQNNLTDAKLKTFKEDNASKEKIEEVKTSLFNNYDALDKILTNNPRKITEDLTSQVVLKKLNFAYHSNFSNAEDLIKTFSNYLSAITNKISSQKKDIENLEEQLISMKNEQTNLLSASMMQSRSRPNKSLGKELTTNPLSQSEMVTKKEQNKLYIPIKGKHVKFENESEDEDTNEKSFNPQKKQGLSLFREPQPSLNKNSGLFGSKFSGKDQVESKTIRVTKQADSKNLNVDRTKGDSKVGNLKTTPIGIKTSTSSLTGFDVKKLDEALTIGGSNAVAKAVKQLYNDDKEFKEIVDDYALTNKVNLSDDNLVATAKKVFGK